jgi:hypothetical protein
MRAQTAEKPQTSKLLLSLRVVAAAKAGFAKKVAARIVMDVRVRWFMSFSIV